MVDLSSYAGRSANTPAANRSISDYATIAGGTRKQTGVVLKSTVDTSGIKAEVTVSTLQAYIDAATEALGNEIEYYDGVISTLEAQLENLDNMLASIQGAGLISTPTTESKRAVRSVGETANTNTVVVGGSITDAEKLDKRYGWGA